MLGQLCQWSYTHIKKMQASSLGLQVPTCQKQTHCQASGRMLEPGEAQMSAAKTPQKPKDRSSKDSPPPPAVLKATSDQGNKIKISYRKRSWTNFVSVLPSSSCSKILPSVNQCKPYLKLLSRKGVRIPSPQWKLPLHSPVRQ